MQEEEEGKREECGKRRREKMERLEEEGKEENEGKKRGKKQERRMPLC